MKTKPRGKGIVKALGQKNTTGRFKEIEKAKGKGAAIGALQNKLAKHRGEKAPYGGKMSKLKKMHKKYGLDMKTAKPGDLKEAFKKHPKGMKKAKKHTDMAEDKKLITKTLKEKGLLKKSMHKMHKAHGMYKKAHKAC